jgi:hypothetical protein
MRRTPFANSGRRFVVFKLMVTLEILFNQAAQQPEI